jgi:hypothetical protein
MLLPSAAIYFIIESMNVIVRVVVTLILTSAGALAADTLDSYHESPYAGDVLRESHGQDHFLVIEHKCGSGCGDCALLFVSYDKVKLIHPSLFTAIEPKLHLKEEYDHAGVTFGGWDVPKGKLYLTAYARYGAKRIETKVVYDLRTDSITVPDTGGRK